MKRTGFAVVVLLAAHAVLAPDVRAETGNPAVSDVRALIWLSARHDRLWERVETLIEGMRGDLGDPADLEALQGLQYDLYLKWGDKRARSARTPEAADNALKIYGRALGLGLPDERTVTVRDKIIGLRLGEAERLLTGRGDLKHALVHVETVLAMPGVSDSVRARASNLRFGIASDRANKLLSQGDLTNGYDQLARVLRDYEGPPSSKVEDARRLLKSIEETTGLLVLESVDVREVLSETSPDVVGKPIALPNRVAIHRVREFEIQEPAVAELEFEPSGTLRARLPVEDGTDYTLRIAFDTERRPDLLVPFSLADRKATLGLPDPVPARMAYVPARAGRKAYFIGLYEVSTGEMNAFRRAKGRPAVSAPPEQPARAVDPKEVRSFLTYAGVDLPSADEWSHAMLGLDGRDLPWGRGGADAVRRHAKIDDWEAEGPEPVTSRAGSIGPYGLHHGLGNVWELVEGWFVLGGSYETPYPLILKYLLKDGRTADWKPDLLKDPRPLEPAKAGLSDDLKRKWKAVLYRNPEDARVQQPGIGFRVVLRIDG